MWVFLLDTMIILVENHIVCENWQYKGALLFGAILPATTNRVGNCSLLSRYRCWWDQISWVHFYLYSWCHIVVFKKTLLQLLCWMPGRFLYSVLLPNTTQYGSRWIKTQQFGFPILCCCICNPATLSCKLYEHIPSSTIVEFHHVSKLDNNQGAGF